MLAGYAADAAALVSRCETISPAELYAPVADVLPVRRARIVDVGAGTGRDAAWFAGAGHEVFAVEPVAAFREAGMARRADSGVRWIDDRLPESKRLEALNAGVDCVLLSGVWQHLDEGARAEGMQRLAALLRPGGVLVMGQIFGDSIPILPPGFGIGT